MKVSRVLKAFVTEIDVQVIVCEVSVKLAYTHFNFKIRNSFLLIN